MANNKKCGIKRIFSAMMAAAVAATTITAAMPLTAMAEQVGVIDDTDGKFYAIEATGEVSEEWDGTVATGYAGGTGTEADPYQIANGQQLAYLAQQVDAGTTYKDVYFKLTADILLNDDVGDEPNEWNPIGGYACVDEVYDWQGFAGIFDGANHKVIGMYINDTNKDNYGYKKGLFSRSTGVIKNIGVTDGTMMCYGEDVGGICGDNEGIISNCYCAVKLTSPTSYNNYGGVCGWNIGTIENSYNKGELNITGAKGFIGGICGYNKGGTISGCYNTGRVYSVQVMGVGGVCGFNDAGVIKDGYNTGEVTGWGNIGGVCGLNKEGTVKICYNTGKVIGEDIGVGGVCGGMGIGEIRECYNSGAITSSYNFTAGVVVLLGTNGTVENCYNMGVVKGVDYVGGVWAASNSSSANTMRNCYNIGSVSGGSDVYPVGNKNGQMTNVYFDSDVVTTSDTTNADFARTTAQLTAATAISDLGFDSDVWSKKANTEYFLFYPGLACFDDSPVVVEDIPVPTGLKATASSRSVKLTWDKVDGIEKYAVYKYVDGKYTTLTSTLTTNSYIVTGLKNGVKVGFKVKAYAGGKWSEACSIVYATPKAPAPINIKATAGDTKATVTWDAVDGATKYAVYKYIDGKYTCLTTAVTGTSYTVTGLENGTKYGFKVKAYVDQWSGASAMAYATPVSANIVPQSVKAKAGNGQATITWSAVSGATKYAVYIYKDGKYTCLKSNITGTSYTATGLENGVKVGFKVKAYVGKWSGASAMAYATPTDGNIIPQNVKATGGDTTATITWDKVAGAERYAVYIYKDGKYTCINSNIKTTSYTATELENGVKVGFKVKTYINGAWSGASAIAWATPNA